MTTAVSISNHILERELSIVLPRMITAMIPHEETVYSSQRFRPIVWTCQIISIGIVNQSCYKGTSSTGDS